MKEINKKYKYSVLVVLFILSATSISAQNKALKLGTNPTMKHSSTILELEATNKGLLIPRIELSGILDVATISTPSNSLLVYNVKSAGASPNEVTPGFYYYSVADLKWIRVFDTNTIHEPWNIQGSQNQATLNSQNIYQTGTVAIGTSTIPTITVGATEINPKFHVAGDISTTGKLWTTNSVYADYVFEKYYDGYSSLNESYQFKSLTDVAAFIKKFKHLPGVTPVSDIQSDKNGYTIDLTELSMQQLEKLEELYIHTIELDKKISDQQLIIDQLIAKVNALESKNSLKK